LKNNYKAFVLGIKPVSSLLHDTIRDKNRFHQKVSWVISIKQMHPWVALSKYYRENPYEIPHRRAAYLFGQN